MYLLYTVGYVLIKHLVFQEADQLIPNSSNIKTAAYQKATFRDYNDQRLKITEEIWGHEIATIFKTAIAALAFRRGTRINHGRNEQGKKTA